MCNHGDHNNSDHNCGHGHEAHGCMHGGGDHKCNHGHQHNHDQSEAFENTYREYLDIIKEKGHAEIARRMGVELRDGAIPVTLFGDEYLASPDKITGPNGSEPSFAEKVVICKYLIMHPETHPEDDDGFISYRDFQHSGPFVEGFKTNAETPIANNFSDAFGVLKKACATLGGEDPGLGLNYDLSRAFVALPKIPVLLLFNDKDDEFPADAYLHFQRRVEKYLDMESLAALGWLLSDRLAAKCGICRNPLN